MSKKKQRNPLKGLRDLLRQAGKRLRELGQFQPRPQEIGPQTPEEKLRDLFGGFAYEIENGKKVLDRIDLYTQAALILMEDARFEGRREGSKAGLEMAQEDCACRCHAHRRVACPVCLDTERCPAHCEPEPTILRGV